MLRNIGFVVFVILVTWALIVWSSAISAHPGGLAKDGCHRDRAAGDRHWHLDGAERGGECVKRDGQTARLMVLDAADYAALVAEQDRLRRKLAAIQEAPEAALARCRIAVAVAVSDWVWGTDEKAALRKACLAE